MVNEVTGKVIAVPPAQTGMGQREDFGKLRVGQVVTIKYDVTSREYNDRFFTTANAFDWKVDQPTTITATADDPI